MQGSVCTFHVIQCGYRFLHREPLRIDRSGLPFYVFVYFRAKAEAELDGKTVPLHGHWILFPPGSTQHYRSACLPYEDDWVHFTAPHGEDFLRDLGIPLSRPVLLPDPSPIDRAILSMQNLQGQKAAWIDPLISSYLSCLFYDLRKLSPSIGVQTSAHRYYPELSQLRTELFSNPSAGTTVEALAARIGLSGSYLQALYKTEFGVSIGEDIIRGRLDRAKYLLANSETPVASVAEASGYRCEAHFMRQFKRLTGMTPGEYRRSTRI